MEVKAETVFLIKEYEDAKGEVSEAKSALKYATYRVEQAARERKRARHKVREHLANIIPHNNNCLVIDTGGGICSCGATDKRNDLREQVINGNYQEEDDGPGHCICPGWDGIHEPDCEYKFD